MEIGSTAFAAQYLQDPVPAEGNIVKVDWLRTYDPALVDTSQGKIVQSWDTAMKVEERHDWSVCITALVRRREVYILDVWRQRWNSQACGRPFSGSLANGIPTRS